MADNRTDWWQNREDTDTTRRTPSPPANDYNTSPDDSGQFDDSYNDMPDSEERPNDESSNDKSEDDSRNNDQKDSSNQDGNSNDDTPSEEGDSPSDANDSPSDTNDSPYNTNPEDDNSDSDDLDGDSDEDGSDDNDTDTDSDVGDNSSDDIEDASDDNEDGPDGDEEGDSQNNESDEPSDSAEDGVNDAKSDTGSGEHESPDEGDTGKNEHQDEKEDDDAEEDAENAPDAAEDDTVEEGSVESGSSPAGDTYQSDKGQQEGEATAQGLKDSGASEETKDDLHQPGIDREEDLGEDEMMEAGVNPELDESRFPSGLYEATRDGGSKGINSSDSGGININIGQEQEEENVDDSSDDDEEEGFVEKYVKGKLWLYIGIPAAIIVFVFIMALSIISLITSDDQAATGGEDGIAIDFSNHNISDHVMSFSGEVSEAMKTHGLHEDWLMVIMGVIQQESGGTLKDIMQSSESRGLPVNTFDQEESIYYGVLAFQNAVKAAESHGITDVRAVLQGYNMNHAFIHWMAAEGHNHWTSDIAEWYSINKVFPAVTGRPASEAARSNGANPWRTAVGKEYYIKNGGDFHYPNAILHHLGVDYTSDDPITISSVKAAVLTAGSLSGYQYPIPEEYLQVTSEYSLLRTIYVNGVYQSKPHKGIDVQYGGAQWHKNQPVYAAADGQVLQTFYDSGGGNMAIVLHGPPGKNDLGLDPDAEISTRYLHMYKQAQVKPGQSIKAGDIIGLEGNTGNSGGDHLHFEIWQNGEAMNPRIIYKFPEVGQ